ncbi:hypothetical protein VEE23_22850 [Escherichia coli]|nr:hypothetical protein VEE23_22850 [Escherichia coli]
MTDFGGKTSIFSHPVYLFLRKFSLQDSRGGSSLDNCITRLRLSVKDMSLVNVQALKDNRAIGVVQLNQHNLQVVIGPQVQSVKDEMAGLMHTVQA